VTGEGEKKKGKLANFITSIFLSRMRKKKGSETFLYRKGKGKEEKGPLRKVLWEKRGRKEGKSGGSYLSPCG